MGFRLFKPTRLQHNIPRG